MVRMNKIPVFTLTLILTIVISANYFLNNSYKIQYLTTTTATIEPSFSLAPLKYVTKSLTELGPMDELNPYVIFFNRVPNCGSEMLVLLLQWLQGWNNFKHVRLKGSRRNLNNLEQEKLVYGIADTIRNHAVPLTFDQQVYFTNFTFLDRQSPTFINLIRDPIEKLLSRLSINKLGDCIEKRLEECDFKDGQSYDLSIPYFCGQDTRCALLNDNWALKMAKSNVDRYFPVVGILDELNTTLRVFEYKLPYFFKGVFKLYYKDLFKPHHMTMKKITTVPPAIDKYVRQRLHVEYEFYNWIKRRLFDQMEMLNQINVVDIK